MYSIKEFVLIPFVCYISVFHSKIILISYLSYIFVSYSNTNLRQYLLFFNENLNEFIQFYQFMCEYNPLLLNYVDDFDDFIKNDLKNLEQVNTTELIKYEDKYLAEFRKMCSEYKFDETEQQLKDRKYIEFLNEMKEHHVNKM